MNYNITSASDVLKRTPLILDNLLSGLSDDWLHGNEGPETWSPFQVLGHLIINEETNFFVRAKLIMEHGEHAVLSRINMTSHLVRFAATPIAEQLALFKVLRDQNIASLSALSISDKDLHKTAIHPEIGTVQLYQVLSTWVAHDLVHLGQITRVMAKQYKNDVGPFIRFLTRLN